MTASGEVGVTASRSAASATAVNVVEGGGEHRDEAANVPALNQRKVGIASPTL